MSGIKARRVGKSRYRYKFTGGPFDGQTMPKPPSGRVPRHLTGEGEWLRPDYAYQLTLTRGGGFYIRVDTLFEQADASALVLYQWIPPYD